MRWLRCSSAAAGSQVRGDGYEECRGPETAYNCSLAFWRINDIVDTSTWNLSGLKLAGDEGLSELDEMLGPAREAAVGVIEFAAENVNSNQIYIFVVGGGRACWASGSGERAP